MTGKVEEERSGARVRVFCPGSTRDRLLAGLRGIACAEPRKWIEVGESNNDGELVEVMRDGLDRLSPGQQPVDENGGDGTVFGCLLTPGDRHRMVEGLREVAVADVRKWIEVGEANSDAFPPTIIVVRPKSSREPGVKSGLSSTTRDCSQPNSKETPRCSNAIRAS